MNSCDNTERILGDSNLNQRNSKSDNKIDSSNLVLSDIYEETKKKSAIKKKCAKENNPSKINSKKAKENNNKSNFKKKNRKIILDIDSESEIK